MLRMLLITRQIKPGMIKLKLLDQRLSWLKAFSKIHNRPMSLLSMQK